MKELHVEDGFVKSVLLLKYGFKPPYTIHNYTANI